MVEHASRSAQTHTGIWRDLAVRKRRTEVDAQLGEVIDIARQNSISTPLLERLVSLIHDIESGKLSQTTENLNQLKGLMI
jgi:2-dehydropantoate 2-reductase